VHLLLVRHAIAGERTDWAGTGRPDHERPLTPKGRERMERVAAGLVRIFPRLDRIATSPFLRAAQTAEILARAYPEADLAEVPALASGGALEDVVSWIAAAASAKRLALVGHEPDLGRLAAFLLAGRPTPALPLRKGGACLLRVRGEPKRAEAELEWFLTPALLRKLGKR
jgi:phosphohistidine phosphatase